MVARAKPTRADRDRERHTRLVETGLDLFTQRGYHNTPIELLCSASGVTTRYFYQLFGSREALMRAVYDQVITQTIGRVMTSIAAIPAERFRERLFAGIEAFLHAYLDDPRHAELACIQAVGVSEGMEARRRQVLNQFAELIAAQAVPLTEQGLLARSVDRELALAMVGGTNELVIDWLQTEPHPSIDSLVEEVERFFDLVLSGLTDQQ